MSTAPAAAPLETGEAQPPSTAAGAPAADKPAAAAKPERLDAAAIAAELAGLKASPEGLTGAEAQQRLTQYGPNAITVHEASVWKKLIGYFWGPIPWMIEAAALISLMLRHWPDFFVVLGLLLYNAAIGFWQDRKAASALAALKKSLAPKAFVRRDGRFASIDATGLVPGDVVEIKAGELVPADVLLIDGPYLSVDQSALTGESLPASKQVGDSAYSGTIARQGQMTGVVTATGSKTFFGRTAQLVAGAGAVSHVQKAVLEIGDFLILTAVALGILLVGVEVYRDLFIAGQWTWNDAGQILQFVLVLLVASVPVAMPAVLSVTMALGALALSRQQAILSRQSAIEELAGVDILCSDKTGTLTLNRLSLDQPIPYGDAKPQDVVLAAALASNRDSDDPIDHAVVSALQDTAALGQFKQTAFTPFDPVNKKTAATVVDAQGKTAHYAKGAPQVVADICGLGGTARTAYDQQVDDLAKRGYRALGVARSDDGQSWTLVGLLSLIDPPRPDAKATIAAAEQLGLSVKMVTGDDVAIGDTIAGQLGMGDHLLAASEVFGPSTDPNHIPPAVAEAVERANGFARVFPEHKYEIVKSLQQRGHIVAMTGDGVNDAPALKQADAGVAVSGATDAARSAAALVLTAPGLSVLVNAIVESRKIFERVTSYVNYRIAMTIDIMVVVVMATLVFDFRPLSAVMIVLLSLLDDIPIMTIAYDNTQAEPRPVRWDMRRILVFASLMGLLSVVETMGLITIGLHWVGDAALQARLALSQADVQTMTFLQLAAGGHLLLFVVRTRRSIFLPPYPSAPLFLAIVATQVVAVLICAYGILVPPLSWPLIGLVWVYVLAWMLVLDLFKIGFHWVWDRRRPHPGFAAPVESRVAWAAVGALVVVGLVLAFTTGGGERLAEEAAPGARHVIGDVVRTICGVVRC